MAIYAVLTARASIPLIALVLVGMRSDVNATQRS